MLLTIRFVGGPWHNRHEPVKPASYYYVGRDEYRLVKYVTLVKQTSFYQYVHTSLIRGNDVAPCTFEEQFPKWRLDRKELEARLRKALRRV